MINYALVEVGSGFIQEDEHGVLCIFTSLERAESYRLNSSRPPMEIEIVECAITSLKNKD